MDADRTVILPNADLAVVDIAKISDYCLNPRHPHGRHKARRFAAALNLKVDDAEELRRALLAAVTNHPAKPAETDEYGHRYSIDFEMVRGDRQAIVRSCWIVRRGENFPRLTSCYVL